MNLTVYNIFDKGKSPGRAKKEGFKMLSMFPFINEEEER